MKIFMTVLMASIAWTAAGISLLPSYNYQNQQSVYTVGQQQQPLMQIFASPQTQAQYQPQQQQFRASPQQLFQPSTEYLPSIPQQSQSYQQQYSQPILPQYQQQLQQPQLVNSQQQYSNQLVQPLSQPQPQPQLQIQPQFQTQPQLQTQPQQLQQQEISYQQMISSPLPQLQKQKHSRKSASSFVLPMPDGLTVVAPPQFKTGRRLRTRTRTQTATKKPIISKSFFIHTAPEETEDEIEEELVHLSEQPRKHYNVLFVKTPVQTNKAAALNFARTLNEERTVVYVLSKKTSAADLQEALIDQPQILKKPEVFFIKYRTPEEAINAQRQIQLQYDSLGGSTSISDEGVAPITSVVGSLDEHEEEEEEEDEIENASNYQQTVQEQTQQQPQEYQDQNQEQNEEQQQPQPQQQSAGQLQYNQSSSINQYLPPPSRF